MGGSKPERAHASDHATLEEVFTSPTFGHPLPETPRHVVLPPPVVASTRYFVRNRLIASGAVVAAALSIMAGVSMGAGPVAQQIFSAQGPAVLHSGGTATTVPGEGNVVPTGSASPLTVAPGATSSGTGQAPAGTTRSAGGAAVVASTLAPQGGGSAPTATLSVVGTGSSAPAASDSTSPPTTTTTTTSPPTTTTTPTSTTTTIPVSSASGGAAPVGGGGSSRSGSGSTSTGNTGNTGNTGDTGTTGNTGNTGDTGNSGDTGHGGHGGTGHGFGGGRCTHHWAPSAKHCP